MTLYRKSKMKVSMLAVIILATAVVGLGWYVLIRKPGESTDAGMLNSKEVLTVNQVCGNPEKLPGQIKILGVVSRIEEDQTLFGLIDKAEGLSRLGGQCSDCLLPVSWDIEARIVKAVEATGLAEHIPMDMRIGEAGVAVA